ncbi:choline dehydrogenase-like flavoprotein [Primorskyibacter sedentarius]|uniref:Choline dehydrogenase-like flavoprotein n=1 Tax=Primorskyibacter sedentarius TaxID=745311 RepID=A0A4R3J3Z5_9RHOB|nr:GMC family oxidoreductase [Primorskyibacter sedentarius]TCS59912.1 choline dehydrogenase-like flavoprotein [Primorskyibacter sedentarius]
MTVFEKTDDSVVVIIGSGAGGGTVANELAKKGIKSVVLEAGKRLDSSDMENDEWTMFQKISWLDKRYSAGGWHGSVNHPTLPAWIVKGYGGSTVHWAGVALRFKEFEFKTRSTYGAVEGANVEDWPVSLEEMTPWYEKAEMKMGVTGKTTGMPHLPWNNGFRVLAEGCRRTGRTDYNSGPMAINSVENDDRPACQQIGFCMQGCAIGAKWSTMVTELPRAEESGLCEIRTDAMALKIEHDASGKVTGVLYADAEGNQHLQKARVVCVAGNSIESPRLLLNSASEMFPDGLANSSGQVGKNYMCHTSTGIYAVMPEKVHMFRGTSVAGIVGDDVKHEPARGFNGGYYLEFLSLGLPFMGAFLEPGNTGWGRSFSRAMEQYDHMSGVWALGEDLAQEQNGVTLHGSEVDQHGLPVPIVAKTPHNNDHAMTAHMVESTSQIYESVGATDIYELPPYPASHNMGTNRMHADADKGVVNAYGQSHDIDNLFVSDGSQFTSSGACNPTLTIVALAIRQAEYIAQEMNAQNI